MPQSDEQLRYSFPIFKYEEQPDGSLMVYGKCTDDSIDADNQIVDSDWSGRALEEWFQKAANVRVQHSPFLYPAGKGAGLEINRDGDSAHWLKAKVVEDTAKTLVKNNVLQDFSIGILNPRVVNHHKAIGGRICGGEIGEVSLVDRGSNKNSRFTIAKRAPGGDIQWLNVMTKMSPAGLGAILNKKRKIVDSSGRDRSHLADEDFAGPGNTFPIEDQGDVPDAASLAHHAENPAQVRQRIRGIAQRKWPGMSLPPTLADKADDDDTEPNDSAKTCMKCKTKNDSGSKKCSNCGSKLGMAIGKADAAQDGVNASGDDDDDELSDDAASSANGNKPGAKDDDDKDSADKALFTKKPGKKKPKKGNPFAAGGPLADKASKDPSEVAGGAEGKHSDPVPGHRSPGSDGITEDPAGQDWPKRKKGKKGAFKAADAPFSMRRLHDATCPGIAWKPVRKHYALKSVADALPLRELQSSVAAAIGAGATTAADEFLSLVKAAEQLQALPPQVLNDARKAFPELFPTAHPTMHDAVTPGLFQGAFQGGGRAPLSAAGPGSPHPNAPVHHISASQFSRSFIQDGRAAAPVAEGRQATASTAVMGQAVTSMQVLHDHVKLTYPDLCHANVTHRDYTQGDGRTGISAAHLPDVPGAPGEDGLQPSDYRTKADARASRSLTKARKKNKALQTALNKAGGMPDPEFAPYRGIPTLDGPVDRTSYIDKALQPVAGGESAEYIEFLQGYLTSGDPRVRSNAESVLKSIGASATLPDEEDDE